MNNNFYKQLIQKLPTGYAYNRVICDNNIPCDSEFIEVNEAFKVLIGLPNTKIIGKRFTEILVDIAKDENDWIIFYKNIVNSGGKKEFKKYFQNLNKWFMVNVCIIEKYYLIMYFTDISKERIQFLELQEKFERIENILNASKLGTWEWNILTGEVIHNERWAQMIGYTLDEISPITIDTWKKFVHPDDLKISELHDNLVFHGKIKFYDEEYRMRHKNGSWVWIQDRGKIVSWTDEGKPLLISGTHTDITWRKIAEEALKNSEEKYRMIFEHTPLGIIHFDKNGVITNCNNNVSKIIGSSRDVLINLDMMKLPDKGVIETLCIALSGNLSTYEGKYKSVTAKKETTVRAIFDPILAENNAVIGGIGLIEDISERKKLEIDLANEKNLLKTTLISVGDGVISTDNKGNIVFLNRVAEYLTGWTQADARQKPFEDIYNQVNEFTREKSENIVKKVLLNLRITEITSNTMLISRDGTERTIEDSAAPILEENGEITGVVLVFRDCSDKKKKQEEIIYLSYHDQLTGLYNRRFYEEELKRLDIKRNFPLTLVMADVNGLKLINDSFGHAMGDELLKKVAEVLKNGCRGDEIIARLGGDEFIFVLTKTTSLEAERIINSIKSFASKQKVGAVEVSISFGYETKNSEHENIQEVFKNAEDYMYRHKLYERSSIRNKTIDIIMNTLYEKSNREVLHSKRVCKICEAIAISMNFDKDDVNKIRMAGLMHDIGKMGIDENILNKPQKLSSDEWKEMIRHPEIGYRILSSSNEFSEIAVYVLEHHEKWDGSGYPKGIAGENISLQARIISVADSYDAMTSDRPYRKGLSIKKAIDEILKCSGTQFDPDIAKIFVEKVLKKEKKYKSKCYKVDTI